MLRLAAIVALAAPGGAALAMDVAFLAHPRTSGLFPTQALSQYGHQYTFHAATQLVQRDGETGEERVLVADRVYDFSVSLDGRSLYYTRMHPRATLDGRASDIYRIDLETGQSTQLTDGPGWNISPVELPGGDVAYLSSRDGWQAPAESAGPAFSIYRIDRNGRQRRRIWPALGSIFALSLGKDGRLYASSGETQGKDATIGSSSWGIWSWNPDGSDFRPEMSNIGGTVFNPIYDWPVTASDGSLLCATYYGTKIYGTILRAPVFVQEPGGPPTPFGSPLLQDNPGVWMGQSVFSNPGLRRFAYERRGMTNLIRTGNNEDSEIKNAAGEWLGIYSHPWPTPGNGCFVTWAVTNEQGNQELGVYAIDDVEKPIEDFHGLRLVVDEPDRHEWMGKPVVAYRETFGHDPPTPKAIIAEDLPEGSPYSVVGTSSVDINEWINDENRWQLVTPNFDDLEWIAVTSFMPTRRGQTPGFPTFQANWPTATNREGLGSAINERMGRYTELIPLKKYRTKDGGLHMGPNPPAGSQLITRRDGRPDTSWQAIIPADQPYSFQVLNAKKEALEGSTARTWHFNPPRTRRTDCQGCHAHWKPDPVLFDDTFAATEEYKRRRQRLSSVKMVVWNRDIEPLGMDVASQPWKYHDRNSPKPFDSWRNTVDDNPAWTPEQQELYRFWQDTGFMYAVPRSDGMVPDPDDRVGPYLDTMPPTLVVTLLADRLLVGACDPHSGILKDSLEVTIDGEDVTSELVEDAAEEIWTLPRAAVGTVVAGVADTHGNISIAERIIPLQGAPSQEPGKPLAMDVADVTTATSAGGSVRSAK